MGRRATLERAVEAEAADFDKRPGHGLGFKVRVTARTTPQSVIGIARRFRRDGRYPAFRLSGKNAIPLATPNGKTLAVKLEGFVSRPGELVHDLRG